MQGKSLQCSASGQASSNTMNTATCACDPAILPYAADAHNRKCMGQKIEWDLQLLRSCQHACSIGVTVEFPYMEAATRYRSIISYSWVLGQAFGRCPLTSAS